MAAAIDTATTFVHVEFFIVAWDDATRGFFAAMERAVARGVTVRLLADHLPSTKIPGSKETFAELDRIGVQWAWMLPVQMVDAAGATWGVLYHLQQQPDGAWRISGCEVVRRPGRMA